MIGRSSISKKTLLLGKQQTEKNVGKRVFPFFKQKFETLRPLLRESEQCLKSERNKAEAVKKQRLIAKSNVSPEQSTYIQYSERLNRQFFGRYFKVTDEQLDNAVQTVVV